MSTPSSKPTRQVAQGNGNGNVQSIDSPRLQVVGGLLVDETTTVATQLIAEASNPVAWAKYAGGVGANAARAAHAIYQEQQSGCVTLHTAVGADSEASALLDCMASVGLNVNAQHIAACNTGRYSAILDSAGNLLLGLADVQIAERLEAGDLIEQLTLTANTTLLLDANLKCECINGLTTAAQTAGTWVAAMAVSPQKAQRLLPYAQRINLLFCNRREAMALTGQSENKIQQTKDTSSLEQLAHQLNELGFTNLIITDAARPLLSCSNKTNTLITVPPIDITHNVNGAGDTLAGATLAAITTGYSQAQAVSDVGLKLAAKVLTGERAPIAL